MKLISAISAGSGAVNEDGLGFVGTGDQISTAWIFDGVTGINSRNYLPGGSDAAWLVARANQHLHVLASTTLSLKDILLQLVQRLVTEWNEIAPTLNLPIDYDPPAACLTLVKNYRGRWRALRLGDSCLFAMFADELKIRLVESSNNNFDAWLSQAAKKRRAEGITDIKALLAEFRPQLIAARKTRNTPGGYGILEVGMATLQHAEFSELGSSDAIMICTDGFYRAVDHYRLFSDQQLLSKCLCDHGVEDVLREIRDTEHADPDCIEFERFKPADDATALVLRT